MNSIPAGEIKRRGLSVADKALKHGAVHVIQNNRPKYVILTEKQHELLLRREEEAYLDRVESAINEVRAGKTKKYKSAAELIRKMGIGD